MSPGSAFDTFVSRTAWVVWQGPVTFDIGANRSTWLLMFQHFTARPCLLQLPPVCILLRIKNLQRVSNVRLRNRRESQTAQRSRLTVELQKGPNLARKAKSKWYRGEGDSVMKSTSPAGTKALNPEFDGVKNVIFCRSHSVKNRMALGKLGNNGRGQCASRAMRT